MKAFERAFRGTRTDLERNVLAVFSVAVAFVCLATSVLVLVNVDGVRARWAHSGRVSVYLRQSATPEQVRALDKALRSTAGVTDVRFVSNEDARRDLLQTRDDELLAALPAVAFPASLEVQLEDSAAAARSEQIAAQLRALPAVEVVETYGAWSQRLGTLFGGGVTASAILAAVVLAAVVSVVSSTIRLSLQRRKTEVEVLKLVGATDEYVRRPFLVEGAVQGAFGAALAVALLAALYAVVVAHLDGSLGSALGFAPTFLPLYAIAGLVVLGGALGAGAALLSLRKLVDV